MKFLVIGCNGMAGHMISLYLHEQGHQVIGYAREKSKLINSIVGDAYDLDNVKKTIYNGEFDSVINCIGILNQFAESNKSDAVFLNAYLPHYLAKITEDTDIQIIHMSTDCVFSGRTGSYSEQSLRDGEIFYDRSKALGELEDNKNLTLRNSIIGPDIKESGIGLLNWFMKQEGTVYGFTNAIWTGQTTLQLAKTMEKAAELKAHGLYNMVPDEKINKYELLKLFNEYIRADEIEIKQKDDFICDKSLIRTRYEGFEYIIPGYEQMIKELGEWIREHKSLYPHYNV